MTTPTTRTPVRIARGTFANLSGSLGDLQQGEITYATDVKLFYVVESGALVAQGYATTGQIAALSGQVNTLFINPVITGTITEDVYTITDGSGFEIDPGNGSIQLITLGASRTPKATNFAAGESVSLMVDDGTSYTLTWTDATFGTSGVSWKTNAGAAPTLNASGYTVITLWKVGSQVYGARVGDA
jgi:hypothetical protein